ncbi:MAG TPA: efflux RND transporter periplasmic adaptor subunit [Terriglobales bacterium]|nr:efflux RND transporter periplasmic adaptor subunit [Terriglobales bacterium]
MKKWKKIAIIIGIVLVVCAVVGFTVHESSKNLIAVQTGKVLRQDLSATVSASGEIKPKTYVNIGANAFGKIVKLYVHEGDRVKKGQMLAQIENVQPGADVEANRANLEAAQTDSAAQEAALHTAQADLERANADLERAKLDYQRAQGLYTQALIAKQEYDAKKAAYDSAVAGVAQASARIVQSRAQKQSADRRIAQASANLVRARDVLDKTEYVAPFDGIVTNLPVREGETVVIGIQNAPGSTLMTLADMSVITAEVRVDETDIVNVRNGQAAEVTIDAMPKQVFHGVVTEIGNNAMVRSTGVSTSQSTAASQEAKDFKVVVTVSDPPENLRPGLSTTAKITTSTKKAILTVPIQALTVRQRADLQDKDKDKKSDKSVQAASPASLDPAKAKEELQGIFVVRNKKAQFVPVNTGISGVTDIEVLSGLAEGDEIVTGSYKVLRTLRNGASVKVDNSAPKKETEEKS